jgi:hypothetical protein
VGSDVGVVRDANGQLIRHPHPTWAESVQFEAPARVQGLEGVVEMMPVSGLDPGRVMICALPFFVYEYSLGDEVELDSSGYLAKLIKRSNIFTYRVSIDDRNETSLTEEQLQPIRDRAYELQSRLERDGFLVEWYSSSYGSVAADSYEHAEELTRLLDDLEGKGEVRYESAEAAAAS